MLSKQAQRRENRQRPKQIQRQAFITKENERLTLMRMNRGIKKQIGAVE